VNRSQKWMRYLYYTMVAHYHCSMMKPPRDSPSRAFRELLLILALCTLFYILAGTYDWAERLIATLARMEEYELDEVIPTALFGIVLLAVFAVRRARESRRLFLEKLETHGQIEQLAYFDTLTGLPNRTLLLDRLQQAIARCRRENDWLAVIFIDLDGFKKINDSLGHAAGDRYLVSIAERLGAQLRAMDTLARFGGDEFVLLQNGVQSEAASLQSVERVLSIIAQPVDLGGREVHGSASIGIALFPRDAQERDTLLKHADMAMYRAKQEGKNRFHFYSEDLNVAMQRQLELEQGLRESLAREELTLAYQPQYDTNSLALIGVEALVRWPRNDGPPIAPSEFIPVAEECGLAGPLGEWVLRHACREALPWGDLKLSVNLSAKQLSDAELTAKVDAILTETRFPARRLELEITETSLVNDLVTAQQVLQDLSAMGIAIAIDDFGTGYCSINYLKQYPIRRLKIDRSFVGGLVDNTQDRKLLEAIIQMSRAFGIHTVAEGVETDQQLSFLRDHGCQSIQGFLMSRPVPPEEIQTLLADAKHHTVGGGE
ncbi:MAG: EAL domain-containing protein, partial [Spirochaetales bacterium]|nr:EAL domain-containing protein [Spirochaetales bacterium]